MVVGPNNIARNSLILVAIFSNMVGSGCTNFMGISGVEMIGTYSLVVAVEGDCSSAWGGETVAGYPLTDVAMSPPLTRSFSANLSNIGSIEMILYMTVVVSIERTTSPDFVVVDETLDPLRHVQMIAYSTRDCGSNFISIGRVKVVGSQSPPVAIEGS